MFYFYFVQNIEFFLFLQFDFKTSELFFIINEEEN